MKKQLEEEVRKLIASEMKYITFTPSGRPEWWDLSEVVGLILDHLNLEPHVECRYPSNVLRSTIQKEKK